MLIRSDSWELLIFARLFWNQFCTRVLVWLIEEANSAVSEEERYCFWRNFVSNSINSFVENSLLGLRYGLYFRSVYFEGANGLMTPISEKLIEVHVKQIYYSKGSYLYDNETVGEKESYLKFADAFTETATSIACGRPANKFEVVLIGGK